MNLSDHPTVHKVQSHTAPQPLTVLRGSLLREICARAGAADCGFLDIARPELDDQRAEMLQLLPGAKTVVSFVCRMNRGNVQTPARSIANLEFKHATDETNDVGRRISASLEQIGIRAINAGAVGFPMEMDRWGRTRSWTIAHKPIAVAAGLGRMGIHRNVIHPKFGNFILLGTVLVAAPSPDESKPINFNPCLDCKLCVAACPTGAISPNGKFNFSACYTHNYREFMGGFADWVDTIVDSKNSRRYRKKVSDAETVSMWQSLSFGANYKAAYCIAVCPAGEEVIAPFLLNRKAYLDDVVRPLQDKNETIYVKDGSSAEAYVQQRFPHKTIKQVKNGSRPASIKSLLGMLPVMFEPAKADKLDATYHFRFTGEEEIDVTIVIRNQTITVQAGHLGDPDLQLIADSRTWLRLMCKDTNLFVAVLRRKIRMTGPLSLMRAFSRCFE